MTGTSLISVVMAVYNGQKYLKDSIDSILKQTWTDFEFIIVNDGSTDSTRNIILSYKDPRIVYLENRENMGLTKSLNIGFRRSGGQYLARMDDDDVSHPDRLRQQVAFLRNNPDVGVVGSWHLEVDSEGRPLRVVKFPADPVMIQCNLLGDGDLTHSSLSHPTVMMRRSVLKDSGFYDERYIPQDYELWVRLSRRTRISNVDKVLIRHTVHKESDSTVNFITAQRQIAHIIRENIMYYLPGLEKEDALMLTRMLRNRPQKSPDQGRRVLLLFELLKEAFLERGRKADRSAAARWLERIRMYYAPMLFVSNRWEAVLLAVKTITSQPASLLSGKFHKNILKYILSRFGFSVRNRRVFLSRDLPDDIRSRSIVP